MSSIETYMFDPSSILLNHLYYSHPLIHLLPLQTLDHHSSFSSSSTWIVNMAAAGDHNSVNLPPGFRFYPTDEELIVHFLQRKASLLPCHPGVIPDLELYPYDPWDLDGKALAEGKTWYFYSRRTQNRITGNGYWEDLGCDEPITNSNTSKRIGVKKYHVFHLGEAPEGVKTNWIMEEYRPSDHAASTSSSTRSSKRRGHSKIDYSKWVICRVYEHSCDNDDGTELSCLDEVFLSLDDFDDISYSS